jgi:polyhydroxybutyrate depolymerase
LIHFCTTSELNKTKKSERKWRNCLTFLAAKQAYFKKLKMKIWFILVLTTALIINGLNAQETLNESMVHDGETREYIVYVPASYDGSEAVPLLFNFHGFTSTSNEQMSFVGDMRSVADTASFILVYPQGTLLFGESHWNVGSWTFTSTADDLGFTEAMIDELEANFNIDTDRVYSCGFSNGGYFSLELACQLSDRIAAIGSVGGTMSTETFNDCNATHPTPVMTIHGTLDPVVSYFGGSPFNSESVENVYSYWAEFNNTAADPVVTNVPDTNMNDGSTVEWTLYEGDANCAAVEHYKVIGGTHDWPGAWGNMDISADALIWNFVSKYDLNGLIECGANPVVENENGAQAFSVYPNPTKDFISVELISSKTQRYQIYSIMGELVLSGQLAPNRTVIDISHLANTIYVLQIGNASTKLVKTN